MIIGGKKQLIDIILIDIKIVLIQHDDCASCFKMLAVTATQCNVLAERHKDQAGFFFVFCDFVSLYIMAMMREHINYSKTSTVSQLQLSEQPADAPHMLGNRAQSFFTSTFLFNRN